MNLKTFQQSELKRFDKKLSSFLGDYLVLDSVARSNKAIPYKNALALRAKMFEEINELFSSSIEKAFTLGKEEKSNEILAGLNKLKLKHTKHNKNYLVGNCPACADERNVSDVLDKFINLLKNK